MSSAAASDTSARRLRRRRRAEWRFRAYGVAALAIATTALVVLLVSILGSAFGAFTVHRVTLPITFDETIIDERGNYAEAVNAEHASEDVRAAAIEDALRQGEYRPVLQRAVLEAFPGTARSDRQFSANLTAPLSDLLVIMDRVLEDPAVLGTTEELTFPLAFELGAYLKALPDDARRLGQGALSVSAVSGSVELVSTQADFREPLAQLRQVIERDLAEQDARARDMAAAAEQTEAELARDPDNEELARRAAYRQGEALTAETRAQRWRSKLTSTGGVTRLDEAMPSVFVYAHSGIIKLTALEADRAEGRVLVRLESDEPVEAGAWSWRALDQPEATGPAPDVLIAWTEALEARGQISEGFNDAFFTRSHSNEPEFAGILGALLGSVFTMIVTMALAVPLGVGAAIYLEEFAPKNRFTDIIEVNINNLAAVPSIIFGLLGLAIVIPLYNGLFGNLSRGWPLVGGTVLALMTLPTIIIATRASLRAVPHSIRQGALAVGASPMQTVFHHVLPLAGPGIMTGSIIGLSQALGETAPLIMIGMVAAVADPPMGVSDPATTLPAQVFLWSGLAEKGFVQLTAAAILVLLSVMIVLNLTAILLRRRFERRW